MSPNLGKNMKEEKNGHNFHHLIQIEKCWYIFSNKDVLNKIFKIIKKIVYVVKSVISTRYILNIFMYL